MSTTTGAVFARRTRQERRNAGITQAELAARLAEVGLQIDASAITRIERHDRAVRLEEAVAIAAVLHVPLQSLLDDDAEGSGRLAELQADLRQAQWQVSEAEGVLRQAQESVVAIEQMIAELHASHE